MVIVKARPNHEQAIEYSFRRNIMRGRQEASACVLFSAAIKADDDLLVK